METSERQAIQDRNQAAIDRLRALGSRLSDAELTRPIDPPWTAAGLLAHVAFWDRFVHARWLLAASSGSRTPVDLDDALLELINDAFLQQWALIPPRAAVEDCLAATAQIDALIESLDDDVVEAVHRARPRLVDRSLHRGEHLVTIETSFPSA
jgi:DinB family protein